MRLLITDSANPNTLAASYVREIQKEHQVVRFCDDDLLIRSTRSIWGKACYRLAPRRITWPICCELERLVEQHRPDAVWLFKGTAIDANTLLKLRNQGHVLVNYNADHPFEFYARGSGNRQIADSVPCYHLHLTYSFRIQSQLTEAFPGISVARVPFGHDVSTEVYHQLIRTEEIRRICFIGNPDSKRARLISALVAAGLAVDVFGFGWHRFLRPSDRLQLRNCVFGNDMYRMLRRYRVQLNILRPHNLDSHNMRTFEIPACGGIMLAEDSFEHRQIFDIGTEAFFFRSESDLIQLAKELLHLDNESAAAVREAARTRCDNGNYSYADRARAAMDQVSNIVRTRRDS